MEKLSNLVNKYYPGEIIEEETNVLLTTTFKLFTGKEVAGVFSSGSLPISMVETDKKYFFDVRQIFSNARPWLPHLKNPLNIFISLFVLISGGYIIGNIFLGSGTGFRIFLLVFLGIGIYNTKL